MTREDVIKELKTRYLTMSQCLDKEELHKANKAIDIAIQTLEKKPCEDIVSRQALLDDATRFMDAFYGENGEMMYSDHILNEADCNNLKEWIKSFPSVTPQQKVGKWVRNYEEYAPYLYCSNCKFETGAIDYMKYCPNCGAKMVKP